MAAKIAEHHAEWLSLVDVSGPFLSVPVLKDALPNGLDAHVPHLAAELRAAVDQWADPSLAGSDDANEVHDAFVRFVFSDVLGFDDDVLRWDAATCDAHTSEVPLVGTIRPDAVAFDGDEPVMLVSVCGRGEQVDQPQPAAGTLSAQDLMVEQLKASGIRVGVVTDGERWTLVSFREGENPGFATWWASLWVEERLTLQSFRTLLGQARFLDLAEDETVGALLDRSAEDQQSVSKQLGDQTLAAVEILIRTIDRIDQERGGELLRVVEEEKGIAELYDAAVTVMMRLIFLFYAEENDLLPVAEPLYMERYAASTLRERLQAAADEHGEEVLENTSDGWPRLLATWRAVYGGVEHGDMVLAPYGGSLFDPDRYPFLEGRQPGTSWTDTEADPLPVDNRTVLHLLNALQTLQEGGQPRKVSFRALDVEQIGHVYEGMLDHTAARAKGWVLGLSGTGGKSPEIELDDLDAFRDEKALLDFLKDKTGRAPATNKKWMADDAADKAATKFGPSWAATFADAAIEGRARRFAKLIRPDSADGPTAFQPGGVYVADSPHRGATGTHYTPRFLTRAIVEHTLDPLIYTGPELAKTEADWVLCSPEEILDLKVCDPACGSGAFLVQACRYLADALVRARTQSADVGVPCSPNALVDARREVAEGCLHGVDINPMAVEMAKLSLWLFTLSLDRPFGFLDGQIVSGDSLAGLTRTEQLSSLCLAVGEQEPEGSLWQLQVQERLDRAAVLAGEKRSIRSDSIIDARSKEALHSRLLTESEPLQSAADSLCQLTLERIERGATDFADIDIGAVAAMHRTTKPAATERLHWPLIFADVFQRPNPGFDAIVGNPPFLAQTHAGTAATSAEIEFRRHNLGSCVSGISDGASHFMLLSLALLRFGGFVSLVQPDSFLASKGSESVRRKIVDQHCLTHLWVAGEQVFEAAVETCSPTVSKSAGASAILRRFIGRNWRELSSLDREYVAESPGNWAPLVAEAFGIPSVEIVDQTTLSEYLSATADHLDQYYGLAGHVVESENAAGETAPLITVGLIDPANNRWGRVSTKFNKVKFDGPVVDLESLAVDNPDLLAWARKRLVPKVLVATQTKVLEAILDPSGHLLPSVPVLTVVATNTSLSHVAAAISSPPATAIAARDFLGSALSSDAIKISAKQLSALPAPSVGEAWDRGAGHYLSASKSSTEVDWRNHMLSMGQAMCEAYELPDKEELMQWWTGRLPAWR